MNRNNGKASWIVALAITLVAVLAAFGIARLAHGMTSSRVGSFTALPLNNVSYIETVGDSLVVYDGSALSRYDSRGGNMWGESMPIGANYAVDANSHGIVLWKGNSFSVLGLSNHNNLYSGNVESDIISAKLGSRYLAVLYGADDNSIARITDVDGRVYDEIEFESQVVLDYGFFSDGSLFWAMSVDTSGTVPTCTVTTYRPSRKSMSGSISDGEQVVYHAQFEKDNICLVGEDYIKRYDYTGSEATELRTLVYGWYLMDMADSADDPLMVFAPTTQASGTPSVSDVRLIDGGTDVIVRMPFACRSLVVKGRRLYGFSDAYVMVVGAGETRARAYAMPMSVDSVVGVTDDHVAAVCSNGLYYLVTLP